MTELGEARGVIVFSLGEPQQRLMGWFLKDSGLTVELTDSLDQTLLAAGSGQFPVLILNAAEPHPETNLTIDKLRLAAPEMRIIVLHKGRHGPGDPHISADICIHDLCDPDHLVETVKRELRDALLAASRA
jgi:hypothetical protein